VAITTAKTKNQRNARKDCGKSAGPIQEVVATGNEADSIIKSTDSCIYPAPEVDQEQM
jgi:hypothetical protein